MVEMLPEIEVVADDAFNSDPADPKNMGPDARQRHAAGETLPTAHVPTPLVRIACTRELCQQRALPELHCSCCTTS